jgi:NAD(P)H-dependent flavin oxidoreductase YrpB (nitropropane dioxygenase family)
MIQKFQTRLTGKLGLQVPLVSAPMGRAAAVAVSGVGGLGLIDGGREHDLDKAFVETGGVQVGISFSSGALVHQPALLQQALKHKPKAVMLSSENACVSLASAVTAAGIPLICQCVTLDQVKHALEAGATIIVSQTPGERASLVTLRFVAEVAEYLKVHSPQTLLLAAGGIADGKGVAAALLLGADGAMMDSAYWASSSAQGCLQIRERQSYCGASVNYNVATQASQASSFNISTLNTAVNRGWSVYNFSGAPAPALSAHTASAAMAREEGPGMEPASPDAKAMVSKIMLEAGERLSGAAPLLLRSSL